ncbi:MAG: acyltransferase family protein [Myxococcales bacterium]|nr:acyltransferase family protein [Myxococcales bacterium]
MSSLWVLAPETIYAVGPMSDEDKHPVDYDAFGFHPEALDEIMKLARWLHKKYFRVRSYGAERIPRKGGVIVAANHSGALPMDGVMLGVDLYENTARTRYPRVIADHFVSRLPYVAVFFARMGAVGGSRRNSETLLESEQLVVVFPEGISGVGKPFVERYRLQKWHVGHAELALRHKVPVLPVGIVGAEEQWPLLARIDGIKAFGSPYLPVLATPIPLPVQYHIHYGEPIALHEEFGDDAAEDSELVVKAAEKIQTAVQDLLSEGLKKIIFQR